MNRLFQRMNRLTAAGETGLLRQLFLHLLLRPEAEGAGQSASPERCQPQAAQQTTVDRLQVVTVYRVSKRLPKQFEWTCCSNRVLIVRQRRTSSCAAEEATGAKRRRPTTPAEERPQRIGTRVSPRTLQRQTGESLVFESPSVDRVQLVGRVVVLEASYKLDSRAPTRLVHRVQLLGHVGVVEASCKLDAGTPT